MHNEEESIEIIVKIVICGDTAVGKTNLLTRYMSNTFSPNPKPTIGVDFLSKNFVIKGKTVKVQFFDTAGQEKYRSVCSNYYRHADGIILVYDITHRPSFENLDDWLAEIKKFQTKKFECLLVGNKKDLEEKRSITTEEGKEFAEKRGYFFAETSAKDDENGGVNDGFEVILGVLKDKMEREAEQMENDELENIKQRSARFGLRMSEGNSGRNCPC